MLRCVNIAHEVDRLRFRLLVRTHAGVVCMYVCACDVPPQQGRIALHPLVGMRLATADDQLPPGIDPASTLIVHRIVVVTVVSRGS